MKTSLVLAPLICSMICSLLPAPSFAATRNRSEASKDDPTVEAVVGYRVDSTGVSFQLNSGGCTLPTDFSAVVEFSGTHVAHVTLLRLQPDSCHPFIPTAFETHFTFEQLGISRTTSFVLTNPNGIALGWLW
jgi:hypothetical protein